MVEDRRIHCAKRTGHGSQNFVEGAQNSCNPVFIEVGLRLGVERYYKYFRQFGLLDKTGTDLPGEAGTIMHQKKNMGEVELATVSFGQSFQITPVQLAATVSSLINGALAASVIFAVGTSVFTVISLFCPQVYYGFGFLAGCVLFYFIVMIRLERYTRRLPYYILSIQPVVAEDKSGVFTRIGCFMDEKLERRTSVDRN